MDTLLELIKESQAPIIVATSVFVIFFARLILSYLEKATENQKKTILERIKSKQSSIESTIKEAIKDEKKQEELLELFRKEIDSKSKELKEIVEKEQELQKTPKKFRYTQIVSNSNQIRNRLINEVDSLTKRANLNLTIGIISSVMAIGFLFYSGWYAKIDFEEKWFNFFTFFLPKFSLLVFLGTFSFYFLNLYKSNLNVIQNYQQELNNVDFRIISIISIILSEAEDKEKSLKDLVTQITNSTWNRTIKKDETTIEIEKKKLDNSFDSNMVTQIWTAFNLYDKIKKDEKNTTPNF